MAEQISYWCENLWGLWILDVWVLEEIYGPRQWRQSEKEVTLQYVRHKSATVAKIASDLETIPECKSN